MAIVVPNDGEAIVLNYLTNKDAPEDLDLRLFKSNTTPAETDAIGTYTEATFSGYAEKALVATNWIVTEGAPSDASAAQQTFASDADQTAESVYGYYYARATSGELVAAERFTSAPFTIENNGDQILITPVITCD